MKKIYTEPVSEFVEIDVCDVIVTSCTYDTGCFGDGGGSDCPDDTGCFGD
jgi:hypothetical protein